MVQTTLAGREKARLTQSTGRPEISIDGVVLTRSTTFVTSHRVESITIDVSSPELGDVLYDGFLIEE